MSSKKKHYKCLFCDKLFPSKFNWQRHCKNVHDITVASDDKKKPVKCMCCGKSFTKKRALYEHCRKQHVSMMDHLDIPVKSKRRKSGIGGSTPRKKRFSGIVTPENEAVVKEHLPKEYAYKVLGFNQIDEDKFHFRVKFDVDELNEVSSFIENYTVKNCIRYRLGKVNAPDDVTVFNKHYCCHHNAQKKQEKNRKNTNCPASASLNVKISKEGNGKLTCMFRVNHNHNHEFDENEVKYLVPNSKVAKKFKNLFLSGLPPFKALKAYKEELQVAYGDDFPKVSKNRSICPNSNWVYNYYYKVVKEFEGRPFEPEEEEDENAEPIVEYLEEEFENDDVENMEMEMEIEYLEEEFENKENEVDELEEFLLLHDQKSDVKESRKLILGEFEKNLFDLMNRVTNNFEHFKDAVKSFDENCNKLKTDAELRRALINFGKIR